MKGLLQAVAYPLIWIVAMVLTVFAAVIPLGILIYFTWWGAEKRSAKALDLVRTTLMKGETVLAQGIQHRVFALWSRRGVLAITNSRILVIRRGLIGGFKMLDVQWKDLTDATIEQNVLDSLCGSNLRFKNLNGKIPLIQVDGVDSETAATIYKTAQFEEQAWEEKRRIRTIEEVRAAAGGVTVHAAHPGAAAPASATPAPRSENRMIEQIQQAKELLDAGAISDAEYQEMKSKIISAVHA